MGDDKVNDRTSSDDASAGADDGELSSLEITRRLVRKMLAEDHQSIERNIRIAQLP